ncbi:hypothetical protein I0E51_07315 [Pseudomonas lalucatii]|nr:hypothetical protein [Pseudomonas lalucatii]
MKAMDITEIAPQLNEIIKLIEEGESVLITINGTPSFRAIPANKNGQAF